jgi:UDP-N-acetylmuramoylalanine--D-glutamate ligase
MKIAIAGFGVEGRESYEYFRRRPDVEQIVIFDERESLGDAPIDVETILGTDAFAQIPADFTVVRTAGLSPHKITSGGQIWSATNEFFARCPAPIIGVTGTKGKGTTATMIRDILQADGQTVYLIGNIGVPALEKLPYIRAGDAVVFELSSFQLWDLQISPHIAVVLRIEIEHLDIHEDMADYLRAKSNITRHQTSDDTVVYYENSQWSRDVANFSAGSKVPYPDSIKFDESVLHVPGAHYVENAKAAIAATRASLHDPASIERGLSGFRAMPHRLELIREIDGVKYYDDNFSTGFPSLDVAVKAFPNNPIILIAGGQDRGLDNFADIAHSIDNSTVKQVLLIGETAPKIAMNLTTEHKICSNITEVIKAAQRLAKPGDMVIMSPGAPSFDMFANFYERGATFQAEVKKL